MVRISKGTSFYCSECDVKRMEFDQEEIVDVSLDVPVSDISTIGGMII